MYLFTQNNFKLITVLAYITDFYDMLMLSRRKIGIKYNATEEIGVSIRSNKYII